MARWRVASLIALHVLIAAHILHWAITGRTLSRFVFSDSIRTLESGEINPAFIAFGVAILATALMGRFLCGWACHMGALQDLCAWVLRKFNIRPRLFTSRVLGYVPVGLALYMFVWPIAHREVVAPSAAALSPTLAAWVGPAAPFPGWSTDWTADRLWEGLPSLWVGLFFLLTCGVATVYFLGARGLCRYGCPYGGILLAAEQCAPIRVVVDQSKCDQCGLCTAACTAGVQVLKEVHTHGAVLDRNCVRSLDCVSVCPQGALSLGLARPALFTRAKAKRRTLHAADPTLWQEAVLAAAFIGTFFVLRGLYGLVPMLMGASLAVIGAFMVFVLMRMLGRPDARLARWQIKRAGRITRSGWVFAGAFALATALLAHSAVVRFAIWRGGSWDTSVTVSYDDAFRGAPLPSDQVAAARTALGWYRLGSALSRGGIGLTITPEASIRVAWLSLVAGDRDRATDELRMLADSGRGADRPAMELGQLLLSAGRTDEAARELERLARSHADWWRTRDLLCALWTQNGRAKDAETLCESAIAARPHQAWARITLARVLIATGRPGDGLAQATLAAADARDDPTVRGEYARFLFAAGQLDDALAELDAAAKARPVARTGLLNLGAAMLASAGRNAESVAWAQRASP
ncbi:MAG TPA: 4Fe-4S binding protein [Phycisphaerales bacterium]|nr:4Fe-4S binding protein [Phycisphaerales bacterium]